MRLRLSGWVERLRASLFFVPMLGVVGAIGAGLAGLATDRHFERTGDLPLGVASTVDSARAVLSTIAGATITFAGVAFSASLLVIQLASSQYSPRVVHTMFRDPFNRRIMGLVVGTFTYCLVVLRSVRSPLEPGGDPVVPSLSVAVAVLLGVATILAIVAFINHSAHAMDVSEILDRIRGEAIDNIQREWRLAESGSATHRVEEPPDRPGFEITFDTSGWVQRVDVETVLRSLPAATDLRLEAFPGRFAIPGARLALVCPHPAEPEKVERSVRAAVAIGTARTMQRDVSYGLRQLADVALKALSPGINDPTTSQDAIFHTSAVLLELLRRDPPSAVRGGEERRRVVVAHQPTHDELIRLAFDETRRAAADQPTVCLYLLEALHVLDETLRSAGLDHRVGEILRQARLVADGASASSTLLADDSEMVRSAYAELFPSAVDDGRLAEPGAPRRPRRRR